MSIIDTLITDRSQEDVDRVRELKQKALTGGGISALTEEEKAEYFNSPKGAYNYTDLNRVGHAVSYVYDLFADAGISVTGYITPKTDWNVNDVPTPAQMTRYLDNIAALREAAGINLSMPSVMDRLNYTGANQIEQILVSANGIAENIMRDWLYSGEFDSGEN